MKSPAWLALSILCVVVLATGFSWFLAEADRDYLFDGERGLRRPELRDWWIHLLPSTVCIGAIVIVVSIAVVRSSRRKDPVGALGQAGIGLLGLLAFAASGAYSGLRSSPFPEPPGLPRPQSPEDVFLPSQWRDLAQSSLDWLEGEPATPQVRLRAGGIGLEGHTGAIPFDPFILDRISFVGLSVKDVEKLLGPPVRGHSSGSKVWGSTKIRYWWRGSPSASDYAILWLATDDPSDDPASIVRAESIQLRGARN